MMTCLTLPNRTDKCTLRIYTHKRPISYLENDHQQMNGTIARAYSYYERLMSIDIQKIIARLHVLPCADIFTLYENECTRLHAAHINKRFIVISK